VFAGKTSPPASFDFCFKSPEPENQQLTGDCTK
jgi:hypothetical protein